MKTFTITDDQEKQIYEWLHTIVYPEWIEYQHRVFGKNSAPEYISSCWALGYPYTGAIGGALTYEFSPTSLGFVKQVTYPGFDGNSEYKLDLTNYVDW